MRLLKLSVLSLLLLFAFSSLARAQFCDTVKANVITCDRISKSSQDTVRVKSFIGAPGDTVAMPVYVHNDSTVLGFQFLIQYNPDKLKPIFEKDSVCAEVDQESGECIAWNVDSTYVKHEVLSDRFRRDSTYTDPNTGFDVTIDVTQFSARIYTDGYEVLNDVIATNFIPQLRFGEPRDSLAKVSGDVGDVLFNLFFEVNASLAIGDTARFNMFQSDITYIDTNAYDVERLWYCNGCNTAQWTAVGQGTDGTEQTFAIYPQINKVAQVFQASTESAPIINTFGAVPSAINPGGSSSLQWDVSNTDSVVIRDGSETRLSGSTSSTGSYTVTPPTTLGTYSYKLQAYGAGQVVERTTSVTVTSGGTTGDAPAMSVAPSQTTYTINQGETVSFTVTAAATGTNAASQTVTLTTLGSLPNNATFPGPFINVGSASGTFSFTPDFNQQGNFTVTFQATDADGIPGQLTVGINVLELQYDRLFSTSAEGQRPVGGLRGTEGISFPINLITSQEVYGVQFDMQYPYSLLTVDSFVPTGRIPEWVVWDNVGDTPGEIRIVAFGMNNEPVESDTTSAIMHAVLTLDSSATPWSSQVIYLENGYESIDPNPDMPSLPLVTDSGIVEVDNPGDVNRDRMINVGDAVNIVAYVIGNYGFTARQFATADLVMNDTVNVYDLMGVVNAIYNIPVSPLMGQPVGGEPAYVELTYDDMVNGQVDMMRVASELPERIAGVQLEINYDPNSVVLGKPALTDDNRGFALSYKDDGSGTLKVVLFSLNVLQPDKVMQIGDADLVEIPVEARADVRSGDKTKLRLTQALLATPSAQAVVVDNIDPILPGSFLLHQNYPNPFNPTTTIEFSINGGLGAQEVSLDIFNVLGQRVIRLVDGLFPVGDHQIVWDATDQTGQRVATGIYLYRLSVGEQAESKKMLFLK